MYHIALCDDNEIFLEEMERIVESNSVFCKYFLHKVAKSFCRLLHLHFVGNCKTPASPV